MGTVPGAKFRVLAEQIVESISRAKIWSSVVSKSMKLFLGEQFRALSKFENFSRAKFGATVRANLGNLTKQT